MRTASRWWRRAALVATAGTMLQLSACTLDSATVTSLTAAVFNELVTAILSNTTGSTSSP